MPDDATLRLSPEEMRRLGYQVVDLLVDHAEHLPEADVVRTATPAELRERLSGGMPEEGTPSEAVLERLQRDVFAHMGHVNHPRFFAFVPSPGNFVGVMADALAAGFNVFAGSWAVASGPAEIERLTIDWLRASCGLPETAGGLFTSGGSMANLTALAVARHVRLDDVTAGAVVYCSNQTHSSIDRGLRLLGFAPEQVRRLPTDAELRLDVAALRSAVADDRADGRTPFCVVANAGTTNTGAVDPLPALVDYCRSEGLWLHVDGAYGAPAVLSDDGRDVLAGLGDVDSLSLDPHKWLFQPFEIGGVLVREQQHLLDAFHVLPEYLKDVRGRSGEINYRDYGIQLTRSFRALKLWMSLQVFGLRHFREAIAHGLRMAKRAEERLRARPGWQVTTPAQLAIVTFRCAPPQAGAAEIDQLNRRLAEAMREDGFAMLSTTELHDRTVLRMCTINPRTTLDDVDATLKRLAHYADELTRAA